MSGEAQYEGMQVGMTAHKIMGVTDRAIIRTFFKVFGLKQFEKHLPPLTYRKRAKVNRCSSQIQVFAVKMARKQLARLISEMDDRLQIFDFLFLRDEFNIKVDEEFDEGQEFLSQMENKLNHLIKEVEISRRQTK